MKKINTVLGEIDGTELGETLFHEHVVNYNPSFYQAFGEKWLPKEKIRDRAVELFKQAKEECGVAARRVVKRLSFYLRRRQNSNESFVYRTFRYIRRKNGYSDGRRRVREIDLLERYRENGRRKNILYVRYKIWEKTFRFAVKKHFDFYL